MQDIRGHDIFADNPSRPAAGAVPGLSDAKKKALYSTSVFNQDDPAAAPQVLPLQHLSMPITHAKFTPLTSWSRPAPCRYAVIMVHKC